MLHASNITCAEFQCICYWTVGTVVWFMLRVTCGRLVFWNQMSKWTKLFFWYEGCHTGQLLHIRLGSVSPHGNWATGRASRL